MYLSPCLPSQTEAGSHRTCNLKEEQWAIPSYKKTTTCDKGTMGRQRGTIIRDAVFMLAITQSSHQLPSCSCFIGTCTCNWQPRHLSESGVEKLCKGLPELQVVIKYNTCKHTHTHTSQTHLTHRHTTDTSQQTHHRHHTHLAHTHHTHTTTHTHLTYRCASHTSHTTHTSHNTPHTPHTQTHYTIHTPHTHRHTTHTLDCYLVSNSNLWSCLPEYYHYLWSVDTVHTCGTLINHRTTLIH